MNSLFFSYHVVWSCRHVTLVHVWKRQGASYFLKTYPKTMPDKFTWDFFLATKTPRQFLKSLGCHATSTDATPDGTWLKRAPGGSSGDGRGSYAGKGVPRKEYFEQMEYIHPGKLGNLIWKHMVCIRVSFSKGTCSGSRDSFCAFLLLLKSFTARLFYAMFAVR